MDVPVAYEWAECCLSLPLFPEMTDAQVAQVARELRRLLEAPHG